MLAKRFVHAKKPGRDTSVEKLEDKVRKKSFSAKNPDGDPLVSFFVSIKNLFGARLLLLRSQKIRVVLNAKKQLAVTAYRCL